jgi:hypothetical protein
MPVTAEVVVDEDVSGDCYHEFSPTSSTTSTLWSLTFPCFPNDQDRLAYIEDVFEGSSDGVTHWKNVSSYSDSKRKWSRDPFTGIHETLHPTMYAVGCQPHPEARRIIDRSGLRINIAPETGIFCYLIT